ncbi:UpxY family transcription antiterminator [Pedobacter sp. BS3]|uniref:UpxY family transcription antiterminator n=1 Tax=Pedobacter sp. BS3 TaxID=2567937 RepID=UPI0011EE8130|nr:UpxY family transcription antiterminator [Pedobacter sp. BS3]TZF84459.1 UpxY family transcription antiterminator [Pedobacter sp. BS3]
MTLEKKWHVVFTRPRWEKKVADLLTKADIENYCPTTRVKRQWSDRKKIIIEPLFKSYVFVRVAEKQKWEVVNNMGVIDYVYYLGKPAIVRPQEIEEIKRFLNRHEYVRVGEATINAGDKVKINSGVFKDLEAEVTSRKGQKIVLNITSLGLALIATDVVNTSLVKIIE